jgi:hypothetical protein
MLPELIARLHAEDIDILLVQESHLTPGEADPKIKDYASCHGKDRFNMKGDGIIRYVLEPLIHKKQARNRKKVLRCQPSESN